MKYCLILLSVLAIAAAFITFVCLPAMIFLYDGDYSRAREVMWPYLCLTGGLAMTTSVAMLIVVIWTEALRALENDR